MPTVHVWISETSEEVFRALEATKVYAHIQVVCYDLFLRVWLVIFLVFIINSSTTDY